MLCSELILELEALVTQYGDGLVIQTGDPPERTLIQVEHTPSGKVRLRFEDLYPQADPTPEDGESVEDEVLFSDYTSNEWDEELVDTAAAVCQYLSIQPSSLRYLIRGCPNQFDTDLEDAWSRVDNVCSNVQVPVDLELDGVAAYYRTAGPHKVVFSFNGHDVIWCAPAAAILVEDTLTEEDEADL